MKRLGQLLRDVGWITADDLNRALRTQELLGGRIGTCLLEVGALDEEQLLRALGHQLGVRSARIKDLENVPREVYELLPKEIALRCQAVPFRALGEVLYVAMLDVKDRELTELITANTAQQPRLFVANEVRVLAALETYYDRPLSERFRQLRDRLDGQAMAAERHGPSEPMYDSLSLLPGEATLVEVTSGGSDNGSPTPTEDTEDTEDTSELPQLGALESRDEIANALLEYLAPRFERVLLFRVVRDAVLGWIGTGSDVDSQNLNELQIGMTEPSIFLNLRGGSRYYRGPLPPMPSHNRIASCWGGGLPGECLVLPIRIQDRLVSAVLCDPGTDGLGRIPVVELEGLAVDAGRALERCILESKKTANRSSGD